VGVSTVPNDHVGMSSVDAACVCKCGGGGHADEQWRQIARMSWIHCFPLGIPKEVHRWQNQSQAADESIPESVNTWEREEL
jgi:hypothetical protein